MAPHLLQCIWQAKSFIPNSFYNILKWHTLNLRWQEENIAQLKRYFTLWWQPQIEKRFKKTTLMAHSHCTGLEHGQGPENYGFLYYAIYCSHYSGTKTGTGNNCFLLYPSRSRSLSRSRFRAVWMSHYSQIRTQLNRKFDWVWLLYGRRCRKQMWIDEESVLFVLLWWETKCGQYWSENITQIKEWKLSLLKDYFKRVQTFISLVKCLTVVHPLCQ